MSPELYDDNCYLCRHPAHLRWVLLNLFAIKACALHVVALADEKVEMAAELLKLEPAR